LGVSVVRVFVHVHHVERYASGTEDAFHLSHGDREAVVVLQVPLN
jgi:hypothetical protein